MSGLKNSKTVSRPSTPALLCCKWRTENGKRLTMTTAAFIDERTSHARWKQLYV